MLETIPDRLSRHRRQTRRNRPMMPRPLRPMPPDAKIPGRLRVELQRVLEVRRWSWEGLARRMRETLGKELSARLTLLRSGKWAATPYIIRMIDAAMSLSAADRRRFYIAAAIDAGYLIEAPDLGTAPDLSDLLTD
jgi:hypothetical protein